MMQQLTPSAEPRIERMTITPEMAAHWLENNNTNNRTVSEALVRKFARDMQNGHWDCTHQGIAFDTNNVLLDGQHRLWAIVYAEVPVDMFVGFGFSRDMLPKVDAGKKRSVADSLRLGGKHGRVTRAEVGVLNVLLGGIAGPASLTPSEASEAMFPHHDAIQFAIKALPTVKHAPGVGTAVTRGVVARAYYSQDHQQLHDFCEMLVTGVVPGVRYRGVVLLRQYLQTSSSKSGATYKDRYGKTQRILLAALKGEVITRLYASTQEYFLLPEEAKP